LARCDISLRCNGLYAVGATADIGRRWEPDGWSKMTDTVEKGVALVGAV
jgi:hypothetical protein